ncbi:type II secretion system F family protein [Candidatus Pacearchaeota archaeon]|nr:type II secretion system F family protein [Candidatus Pacearchaeota archaeon]
MKISNIIPSVLREVYYKKIILAGITIPPDNYISRMAIINLVIAIVLSSIGLFFGINIFISFIVVFIIANAYSYFRISLKASARIKKMEYVFPDFIHLMASNLRSGMTIDKSFFLSARPEFAPLDKEIIKTGKDIATGKDMGVALRQMAQRIGSNKINSVVSLIISGIISGGNMSMLLEQTAGNMREREFIERGIFTSVLMYVIFIFFAVSVGAPLLFGLSYTLVDVLTNILGSVSQTQVTGLPFKIGKPSITVEFIRNFSLLFILGTNFLASIILGLIKSGEEKTGLKYFVPLIIISVTIYFVVILFLSRFFTASFFGGAFGGFG